MPPLGNNFQSPCARFFQQMEVRHVIAAASVLANGILTDPNIIPRPVSF